MYPSSSMEGVTIIAQVLLDNDAVRVGFLFLEGSNFCCYFGVRSGKNPIVQLVQF